MNKFSEIFSTILYIGHIKWMPGTIGSLFSLFIVYFLEKKLSFNFLIILFLFIFILSIKFIDLYSKIKDSYDAKEIIIDEFLGIYLIVIFTYKIELIGELTKWSLIFILFRFFDILKPYPINWIDKNLKNSYGVILDDICAAIYTIIIIFSFQFLF